MAKFLAASKQLSDERPRPADNPSFLPVLFDDNNPATRMEINAQGSAFFCAAAGLGRYGHPELEVMARFPE
jgi:hypothetical protein